MGHLPFTVVHGRLFAGVLVAFGGAVGVAAVRLLRSRGERGFVTYQRRKRGNAVGGLVAGRATIRGTLRGRAARAVRHDETVIRECSDDLRLEVDGTTVAVQGEVDVAAGTRAQASWRGIPQGFVAKEGRDAWRAYEVRDGDEVIATGELANAAGSTDGTYREAAGGWVLKPLPDETTVEVFAANPVAQPWALHPLVIAILGAVFAAASYAVLWGIGGKLVLKHPALVAAFPGVRGDALEQFEHTLQFDRPHTDDVLAQRLDLAELMYGCGARARIEGAEELYEAELADACGDADATIEALAYLGRYKEASAAATAQHASWPPRNGALALAAGDWTTAAAAADDLVRRLRKDASGEDAKSAESGVERAQCFAAWFRAKAGDPSATAQLATLGPANALCAAARAMLLPTDQRGAALTTAWRVGADDQMLVGDRIRNLAWAYGIVDRDARGPDLFRTVEMLVGHAREGDLAWLSAIALSTRGPDAKDRGVALIATAALDAVRGDFAKAMASLREARTPFTSAEVDWMHDAIALHLPDAFASASDLGKPEKYVRLRGGEMPEQPEPSDDRGREIADAVRHALAGDGDALRSAIEGDRVSWTEEASTVLAVLPHVRAHRSELAASLHYFHDTYDRDIQRLPRFPFSLLAAGAMHRDLARLAGDEPAAKLWQQRIDAQLPVLDDPDRVVALLLWQDD